MTIAGISGRSLTPQFGQLHQTVRQRWQDNRGIVDRAAQVQAAAESIVKAAEAQQFGTLAEYYKDTEDCLRHRAHRPYEPKALSSIARLKNTYDVEALQVLLLQTVEKAAANMTPSELDAGLQQLDTYGDEYNTATYAIGSVLARELEDMTQRDEKAVRRIDSLFRSPVIGGRASVLKGLKEEDVLPGEVFRRMGYPLK